MSTNTQSIGLAVSLIVIQTAMEVEECLQLFVPVDIQAGPFVSQLTISGSAEGALPRRLDRLADRIAEIAHHAFEQGHNPSGTSTGLVEFRAYPSSLAVTVFYQDRC